MDDVSRTKELISALADGQLRGDELASAVRLAASDAEARAAWHVYHLVGDVLRSQDLACASTDAAFMARLSARLAHEPMDAPEAALPAPVAVDAVVRPALPAANDAGFRWKMVAGLASVVAVTAVGWTSFSAIQAGDGARLASATAPSTPAAAPVAGVAQPAQVQQQVNVAGTPQIMLRDPRLDELMSAHRQFGDASALQMPAGFLRNATFEAPGR